MRLSIVRDGNRETVEVDPATATVTVGSHAYPYQVVRDAPGRVELEIGGEKVAVEGWPEGLAEPPGPVDVNGERWRVREVRIEGLGSVAPPTTQLPSAAGRQGPSSSPPGPSGTEAGVAVLPPMPGKVIEVRVKVGEHVEKEQVLLVLEAMKMRNEVASPVNGTVLVVAVGPGSNVRARETMVRLAPD